MTDKVVDNEATRKILEEFSEDDVVYPRSRTEFYFKLFWSIGSLVNFYIVYSFFGTSSLMHHFGSFILGVMAVKIYYLIPAYMDLAEEIGMVEDFDGEPPEG